jgi:hypothetical protein
VRLAAQACTPAASAKGMAISQIKARLKADVLNNS